MNSALKPWVNKVLSTRFYFLRINNYEQFKILNCTFQQYASSTSKSTKVNDSVLGRTFSFPIHKNQNIRVLSFSSNRCWKCNAIVTERDLVCMSCGTVQEPRDKLNYFEVFKETPHYDIDVRTLSVKFRRLQTLLHPDKFATRPEIEKGYSAEQSALVNKAYQTLLRPIERGLYLLKLHLKPLEEDSIQMPPEFLMDIMEINERLQDCNSVKELEEIRHVNDAKLQMLYADVSLAFKEKNIDRARELLAKLKYYVNIDEKIRLVEDQLGVCRDDL